MKAGVQDMTEFLYFESANDGRLNTKQCADASIEKSLRASWRRVYRMLIHCS